MLPAADEAYLRDRALAFDTTVEANMLCVVIHDYPVPEGLGRPTVELLLRLPATWPDGQPDMFWVQPSLKVRGAFPPATEHHEAHLGQTWQRWSRHLQGGWRVGDDLSSWLRVVAAELAKAAA